MFNLGVFRHRVFEAHGFKIETPDHYPHTGKIGDGKYHTVTGHTGGSSTRDGWVGGNLAAWQIAMGISWMNAREIAESIPPAYTKLVGEQAATDDRT
jgi:hypothetical protein